MAAGDGAVYGPSGGSEAGAWLASQSVGDDGIPSQCLGCAGQCPVDHAARVGCAVCADPDGFASAGPHQHSGLWVACDSNAADRAGGVCYCTGE